MENTTISTSEAIKEISKGNYGVWSFSAKSIKNEDEFIMFMNEFKEQLEENKVTQANMERIFPEHIINALK